MSRSSIAILLVLICAAVAPRLVRADEADDQYAVAAGHYQAARWSLAVDEFHSLLKNHPDYREADRSRFFLGEALVQLGRYDEAQTQFQQFLTRLPQSPLAPQAAFRAGEAALLAGHADAARKVLSDFRAKYPDHKLNAYVLNYLGQLALGAGDGKLAESLFRESLTRFPNEPTHDDCRFGLAQALEHNGDRTAAEKTYHELAEGTNAGLAEQGLLRLAMSQSADGRNDDAVATFAAFEKKYPSSKSLADARLEHARALYQLGRFDQARDLLKPLADDPKATAGRYLLALVEQSQQHHAEALKLLAALASDAPADVKPKIQLARAASLIATDQFAAAATELEAYLKSQPGGLLAQRATAQLTVCYARSKKLDLARETYEKLPRTAAAGDKSPTPGPSDNAAERPSDLWLSTTRQVAEAALAAGDAKWAAELFTALAADGNPPEYLVRGLSGLGWCQLDQNDAEKAAATFDQLLAKFPDSELASDAAWARGQALERLAKLDAALASYQMVIDKFPKGTQFPDALLAAARLLDQLHQEARAIELYERFVAEQTASPQLDAARYGWAWALCDAGKRADADAQFQKIHDNFSASRFWPDATFRLAESAVAAKQFDQARKLLDELAAAKPPEGIEQHLFYLKGEMAAAQQQWDQVNTAMNELVRRFPDSSLELPACYWIAEASYRLGKYDDAAKQLAALQSRTAGRKDSWLAMVPLRQAQVLAQHKQWSEAQSLAAKIETDFPNFAQQYEADYVVGRALAAQADFDGARKSYLKVVRSPTGGKTETAAMAQWMIGETYFHQENYDAALREYLRVEILYSYPRWQAAAVLQAGKCEELLGRKKEAAEMYARLIKAYPNTEFTEEGKQRLHALEAATSGASRAEPPR